MRRVGRLHAITAETHQSRFSRGELAGLLRETRAVAADCFDPAGGRRPRRRTREHMARFGVPGKTLSITIDEPDVPRRFPLKDYESLPRRGVLGFELQSGLEQRSEDAEKQL